MLDVITKAAHNYISHQLRLGSTHDEHFTQDLFHQCSIDILGEFSTKKAIMSYSDAFIKNISEAMLFEPEPDEATTMDLVRETTNLIVGSAKIIASDDHSENFDIGLPLYDGMVVAQKVGTLRAFYIDKERVFQLALQG